MIGDGLTIGERSSGSWQGAQLATVTTIDAVELMRWLAPTERWPSDPERPEVGVPRFHQVGAGSRMLALGTPHRLLDAGRNNKPVLFQLDDVNVGPAGMWAVKFRARDRRPAGLFAEMIGAQLAAELGVLTPAFGLLVVPQMPPPTSTDAFGNEVAAVYSSDRGRLAFCSRYLDDGVALQGDELDDLRSVPDACEEDAIRIFALDVLLRHYDRGRGNPNVLRVGDRLVAIDHGLALADMMKVDESGMQAVPSDGMDFVAFGDHVSRALVTKRPDHPAWNDVEQRVGALSSERIDAMVAEAPADLDRSPTGGSMGLPETTARFLKARKQAFAKLLRSARVPPR